MIYTATIGQTVIRFNGELYHRIRHARSNGCLCMSMTQFSESNFPIDHELRGKVIRHKTSGRLFIITKVLRRFDAGWSIVCQFDTPLNGSYTATVQNINSICDHHSDILSDQFDITDITHDEFFVDSSREWYENVVKTIDSAILKAKNKDHH